MIVSLNWLKKYTDVDMPLHDLAALIGERLVEIEQTVDLSEKHKDAIIVRVIEADKLEGSDHLNLTKIDDGGVVGEIERDEKGYIQVVCGAPNVRAGQLVVWLPPGSVVPITHGTDKPFELGSRKLMGSMSHGMIASAKELDLYDEHEVILEIVDDVKPGTLLAEAYELDDCLLDIENKSLTHRPDCFSIVGFAREVSAIRNTAFLTPGWLKNISPDFSSVESDEVKLNVSIDDSSLSSRYTAIVMSGADGEKQSPLQIQTYLSRTGVRPISAVVDVTNYLMMLTGQPLHAFDYDKLVKVAGGKAEIHVRAGRDGEELMLLDGRTIKLSTEDIIIAAGDTPIALAGAMGGANTEIDENTKNIIIESATFNMYNLRATQMRHGIFSEAITRFTKGQPASLSAPVLFEAIRLMSDWAGGRCVSKMEDDYPIKQVQSEITFSASDINAMLGSDYGREDMIKVLKNVEFSVSQDDSGNISAIAPYWRGDIHIVEDIAEEISRLNGFDNIRLTLPTRDYTAIRLSGLDEFKNAIRRVLVRAGANEALTYSFVNNNLIEKALQDPKNSYRIVNSISPDLSYYRQSLAPSLLDLVHPNIKQGFDNFALFEINKTHSKQNGLNEENVPFESDSIALVSAKKTAGDSAQFYQTKRLLDFLAKSLSIEFSYRNLEFDDPITKLFEPKRSAEVVDSNSGARLGFLGEYKKSVIKSFKLPESTAGFELDVSKLYEASSNKSANYKPLSRYPSSERDICFRVGKEMPFNKIVSFAKNTDTLDDVDIDIDISPLDIYQSENSEKKNMTIRVKVTPYKRTLSGEEVNEIVKALAESVVIKAQAEIV
jgi:phenylalanyl-tRNA synthetase beta chain